MYDFTTGDFNTTNISHVYLVGAEGTISWVSSSRPDPSSALLAMRCILTTYTAVITIFTYTHKQ